MRTPRHLHRYGATGLLLEWEQRIDPHIGNSVTRYADALREVPGIEECVPAYASLLLTYSPTILTEASLRELVYAIAVDDVRAPKHFLHHIPVCYDACYGLDLAQVSEQLGRSVDDIIQLHCRPTYLVYFLGYQPGFAFLGATEERLEIPRKREARTRVPGGSVGLAGRQTGIYPTDTPGGWQIIGRCPLPLLNAPQDDLTRFRAGDRVEFYPVTAEEFKRIHQSSPSWPQR